DGIRDGHVTGVQTCLFRSGSSPAICECLRRSSWHTEPDGAHVAVNVVKCVGLEYIGVNHIERGHIDTLSPHCPETRNIAQNLARSEERRVGKERRYRWEEC